MSSRQPQPRDRHAAVGFAQKLYIWEGDGGSAKIQNSAIDVFDLSSETWNESLKLRGSLPAGLQDVAVTIDGECAYSFGGIADSFLNAVFKVQLSTLQCAEVQQKNCTHAPMKKCGSGVVYFNHKLVVYGGWTGLETTDELNAIDTKTGVWMAPRATGEKPPPLYGHTFTKVDHYRAVVFGGIPQDLKHCGTYVLDMKLWNWTKLKVTGIQPRNREYHAACCIAGPLTGQKHPLLMVIGGMREDMRIVNDVWILDVDESHWTEVTLPAVITPRHGHSAVVFENGPCFKVVVLFGGKQPSRLSDKEGSHISDTTLLLLEQRSHGGTVSWEVTRVVRADLQEQIKELEVRLKDEQEKRSATEWELEQRLKEEQEKRAETERCMQLLEKRVTDLEQRIQDLTTHAEHTESSPQQEVQEATGTAPQTPTKEDDVQQSPVLDTPPLPRLMRRLSSSCGTKIVKIRQNASCHWKDLACFLDFPRHIVKMIEKESDGLEEAFDELIHRWLNGAEGTRQPVTWNTLLLALEDAELTVLAADARKVLCRARANS